mgnify:CR=1 FL=1|jgi:4-alpha-glucanotransferase
MLICGEDLGDMPPEVPPVLTELGVPRPRACFAASDISATAIAFLLV